MAIFGVPVAHEDDAERAVRAALQVRDHIRVLNAASHGHPAAGGPRGREFRRGDGGSLGRTGGFRRHGRHGEHGLAAGRPGDGGPHPGGRDDTGPNARGDPLRCSTPAQGEGEGGAARHLRGARPGAAGRSGAGTGVRRPHRHAGPARSRAGTDGARRSCPTAGRDRRSGDRQESPGAGAGALAAAAALPGWPVRAVRAATAPLRYGGGGCGCPGAGAGYADTGRARRHRPGGPTYRPRSASRGPRCGSAGTDGAR